MKLCRSCYYASPSGSVYCGGCGRTFGVKLCSNKHPNAPSPQVQCCTICGSFEMTEPTLYWNLSWIGPLLAGLAALFLWRWGMAHLALLGSLLGSLTLKAVAVLLNTTPCHVIEGVERTASGVLTLWLLGWMLILLPGRGGSAGTWLRAIPTLLGRIAWQSGRTLTGLTVRSLRRALWPPPRRSGPTGREKPE